MPCQRLRPLLGYALLLPALVPVLGLLVYVMLRFNARANPVPTRTSHNTLVEVLWTIVPILILVGKDNTHALSAQAVVLLGEAGRVLLALLRGGGLEALSGMRAVSRPVVRPLLEVTREETTAFCRSLRLRHY